MTVYDPLGDPLEGARISVQTGQADTFRHGVTGMDGRLAIPDVVADTVTVWADWGDEAGGYMGTAGDVAVRDNGTVEVAIRTFPWSEDAVGLTRAHVLEGGIGADGRSLDFELDLIPVMAPFAREERWYWWAADPEVTVAACTPDATNDATEMQSDCVQGASGFDASYSGSAADPSAAAVATSTRRIDVQGGQGSNPDEVPYSTAAVLVDASAANLVSDVSNARLKGIKYFLSLERSRDAVTLAAYAGDDPPTGRYSLLPVKPATVYPAASPGFTSNARDYFPTADALASLAGGSAPMLDAIRGMLQFTADGPHNVVKAVVAVTGGPDDTCRFMAECRASRDAVLAKSRELAIPIVTVAYGRGHSGTEAEELALMTAGADGGAVFRAANPGQLAKTLGVVWRYLSGTQIRMRASFHIESSLAGTFQPGRIVRGTVSVKECPFECSVASVPFVVSID